MKFGELKKLDCKMVILPKAFKARSNQPNLMDDNIENERSSKTMIVKEIQTLTLKTTAEECRSQPYSINFKKLVVEDSQYLKLLYISRNLNRRSVN